MRENEMSKTRDVQKAAQLLGARKKAALRRKREYNSGQTVLVPKDGRVGWSPDRRTHTHKLVAHGLNHALLLSNGGSLGTRSGRQENQEMKWCRSVAAQEQPCCSS